MIQSSSVSDAHQAIRARSRDDAARHLRRALDSGSRFPDHYLSVVNLAREIGEVALAIEAGAKAAASDPSDLRLKLKNWEVLARYGREEEVLRDLRGLSSSLRKHPSVVEVRANLAMEAGDFDAAEDQIRWLIANGSSPERAWFWLSTIKQFERDDPDIARMEVLASGRRSDHPADRAQLDYALGKAWFDAEAPERALYFYRSGARERHRLDPYDRTWTENYVDGLIRDFTPDALSRLVPSRFAGQRALFVMGMPRSGSTLVEQVLAGHSMIDGSDEIDAFTRCLLDLPTPDFTGALAYQDARASDDPWGDVARTYHRLLQEQFGAGNGMLVDKTLLQSHLTGLLLHAMPEAKVVWMRRNPDDVAWSCFRTLFVPPTQWSWRLDDIAHFMRLEKRMFHHFSDLFPDRILALSYEELVRQPDDQISRLLGWLGLADEDASHHPEANARYVKTASLAQVRKPISDGRIGVPPPVDEFLDDFRTAFVR